MKLNWGTGIAIAIIAFMLFILFMVFKASNTSTDLYAEDYYEQELDYETRIQAIRNSQGMDKNIEISVEDKFILIVLSDEIKLDALEGAVHFYRPDNARFDKHFPLKKGLKTQRIPREELAIGNYQVKINWTINQVPYFVEKSVFIQP
ncbi:MAG: FixH family protein [Flavobacteriales bacterium]|jgi:nitrogen fixation protein FixH|nr:FixH family protein [Flavobacteriaceae bacterium]MDP4954302.1 FixH family protein [Flavobacteriales bacterium]